jgi:hypothetical protein
VTRDEVSDCVVSVSVVIGEEVTVCVVEIGAVVTALVVTGEVVTA